MHNEIWILKNPPIDDFDYEEAVREFEEDDEYFNNDDTEIEFDEDEGQDEDEECHYTSDHYSEANLGDELWSERTSQHGVIVGIIKDRKGNNACYKVFFQEYIDDSETDKLSGFDYIQALNVTIWERCGDVCSALAQIGYEWVDNEDLLSGGYFYCKETEDIAYW